MSEQDVAKEPLGLRAALIDAICGRDIDYYPRVMADATATSLATDPMMLEISKSTQSWDKLTATSEDMSIAIDLARQSLDEVKAQTEYQDQKATRLLTVTTFVTALSGALFTRLNDAYPIDQILGLPWHLLGLVSLAYLGFGAFLLCSLSGALVTFHATRTRFKYKASDVAKDTGLPKSRLFYQSIVGVRPSAWTQSFVEPAVDKDATPTLRSDLQIRYLRDLVGETYLVACKTADKLRYLDPAQRLLAVALRCLIGWICFLGLLAMVPHDAKAPAKVELLPGAKPLAIKAAIVSLPAPRPPASPSPPPTSFPAPTPSAPAIGASPDKRAAPAPSATPSSTAVKKTPL